MAKLIEVISKRGSVTRRALGASLKHRAGVLIRAGCSYSPQVSARVNESFYLKAV